MTKVSIVVPVYNAEKYLENSIKSLLSQTQEEIEIIFVDDGSTDGSYKILSNYSENDERIVVRRIENAGPGVARNIGFDMARGEYVIFLDADDYFSDKLIEVMYEKAQKEMADITICSALRYDETLKIESAFQEALMFDAIPYGKSCFSPEDVSHCLFQITAAFAWNKMFRTSFLKDNGLKFAENYCYEDMALIYPALMRADRIAVTHEELIKYRFNAGESLSDNRNKYWKDLIDVFMYIQDDMYKLDKYQIYERTYLNKISSVLTQVFRSYTTEEAFVGVFNFAKENIVQSLKGRNAAYYHKKNDYLVMSLLLDTESPLEFILKVTNIRQKIASDITNTYWIFPYDKIEQNSKIVLFGAGDVGRDLYIQLRQTKWCKLVAWIDSASEKYRHKGFPVDDKTILSNVEYDYVLICVRNEKISQEIKTELVSLGVTSEKIIIYPDLEEKDFIVCRCTNG